MNIVLLEPEIPANTGNIGRTCVATGTKLHLIKPLGFDISDKAVRRAGMDYWKDLDLSVYENFEEFLEKNPKAKIYMATTKAEKVYTEVAYEPDDFIMFGKESAGIPEEILLKYPETSVRIPMIGEIRSLNLGNSVAIMLYEALRQNQFEGMNTKVGTNCFLQAFAFFVCTPHTVLHFSCKSHLFALFSTHYSTPLFPLQVINSFFLFFFIALLFFMS